MKFEISDLRADNKELDVCEMKYERFEDLPVWKLAADLGAKMFEWTTHPSFRGKGDLANQLQRAALSISNNIAEGFERGTTKELLSFLYIARGSAGEVRSMLCVMERMGSFDSLNSEITELKEASEWIARQIRGWANSLQNSEIEGQRYLNQQSRMQYDSQKQKTASYEQHRNWQAAFEQKLRAEAAARNELDAVKKETEEEI